MQRDDETRRGGGGTAEHPADGPRGPRYEAERMRRAWWFGGSLVVAVLIAATVVAWNDLRVRREAGERYLQALVDSHARQVDNRIDGIERAMHGLANGLEAIGGLWPDAAPVFSREQMRRIAAGHPHVRALRESAVAPPYAPTGPVSPYTLYLGPPARGADGHWIMPLAMPFGVGADGRGTRWLLADLETEAFFEILGAHEVGEDGVASLLTLDAILIARSDSGTRHAGLDSSASPVFRVYASEPRGLVENTSVLDGVHRLVGYQRVDDRPLVATVGMTPRALYGGWWTFVATLAFGMLLLVAAWLVGMGLLARAAARESRMRRKIAAREHAVDHLRARVRDAEEQYRFLYRQHPLPAFVHDRETLRILEANDAAELQFGYRQGEMAGLLHGDLLADGDEEDVRQDMAMGHRSSGRRVWSMRRSDGTGFRALVFSRNLEAFAGRPARLVLAVDVTDRERAEANLRLLRKAVEASEEGVFILETERRTLVYGNAAFAKLTGADDALSGPEWRAGVDAIVDPETRRRVGAAIDRAEDVCMEVDDDRDPADVRSLEVRLTPVLDAEGRARHFVGIVSDITLRKRAAAEMEFRARHDALTGLANRDCLVEEIDRAIEEQRGPLVVCHLDLDRFQLVNDSLGHGVGDELLVQVARRLEAAAGSDARVARLGADEFGAVLPLPDGKDAKSIVEALREAVSGTIEVRGAALHVTPSLGYSRHPADADDATTLLRAASQAGAQAKRMGRNRSVGYQREFDSHAGDRLVLVQELHRALEREEFELAFQLQFDAAGSPCGLEALVRWRHPERGLLGPGEFMDACEDSGLVLPLGRWVLREATRRWRQLAARGWEHLRIGVNISALQFQEGLVDDVARVMEEFDVPRDRLELELTESVLLASPADAGRAMAGLNSLGASLAIDDFGTGYSSLAYLKHLPLQRLKLDQSFVRDVGRDPDSEAICNAILRMAQGLDLAVIAEGVETEHQHEWLRERGCDEFQGYLFARPRPFDAVLERLGEGPGDGDAGPATRLA